MTDQTRPPDDPERCPATCADGTACDATPRDTGWCFAHDPALDDVRDEARRRGGRNRSDVARALAAMPDPLAEAVDVVADAIVNVRDGRLASSRGQAIASLTRALVAVWDQHATARRLDDLEAKVAAARGRHLRAVP